MHALFVPFFISFVSPASQPPLYFIFKIKSATCKSTTLNIYGVWYNTDYVLWHIFVHILAFNWCLNQCTVHENAQGNSKFGRSMVHDALNRNIDQHWYRWRAQPITVPFSLLLLLLLTEIRNATNFALKPNQITFNDYTTGSEGKNSGNMRIFSHFFFSEESLKKYKNKAQTRRNTIKKNYNSKKMEKK